MKKITGYLIIYITFLLFFPGKIFAVNLLQNGDFDSGSLSPWVTSGGGATAVISSDIKSETSTYSIKVSNDKTSSYGFQQTVNNNIVGGNYYEAFGSGFSNDPNLSIYFMRIAWYERSDGSGSQISTVDSNTSGSTSGWTDIDLLSAQAPSNARSVKVRVVLESKTDGVLAAAYFDDLVFQETTAPVSTVTPTNEPVSTSTPVPTATPTLVPTAISTSTPTPTKKPTPTITSTPTPEISSSEDILLATDNLSTPTVNNSEGQVLGVETDGQGNKMKLPIIFISLGLLMIFISLGALLFPKLTKYNKKNESKITELS
jgi:hypothetical protein